MVGRNCKVGKVKTNPQPGTEWGGRLKASWLTPEPNMAEVVCTSKTVEVLKVGTLGESSKHGIRNSGITE